MVYALLYDKNVQNKLRELLETSSWLIKERSNDYSFDSESQ